MNIRKVLAISGLALIAAAPFAAQAGGAKKASDACIQAFVDTYLPKDKAVRVRKSGAAASPLRIYTRQYTVDLSANLGSGKDDLVSARCVANGNGEVIALEGPRVEQNGAKPGFVAKLK